MFNRFTKDARRVAEAAGVVAAEHGSPTVEAEHVVSAVMRTDAVLRGLLADAGLDEASLAEGVEAEAVASLAAIGLAAEDYDVRASRGVGQPRWATSAKSVLEGSLQVALDRRDTSIGPAHVLVAALRPERGTLPRTLAVMGVDRVALLARVETAMAAA